MGIRQELIQFLKSAKSDNIINSVMYDKLEYRAIRVAVERTQPQHDIFYSETTLNGKTQVKTKMHIDLDGVLKVSSNAILTHVGSVHNNLNNYWCSAEAIKRITDTYVCIKTSF